CAGEGLDEGAFARTVLSHEGVHFTGEHAKAHGIECFASGELDGDAGHTDERLLRCHLGQPADALVESAPASMLETTWRTSSFMRMLGFTSGSCNWVRSSNGTMARWHSGVGQQEVTPPHGPFSQSCGPGRWR